MIQQAYSGNYKTLQLQSVTNLNGSTNADTISQVIPVSFTVFLSVALTPEILLNSVRGVHTIILYLVEYVINVLAVILSLTVFSQLTFYIFISLSLLSLIILFVNCPKDWKTLKNSLGGLLYSSIPSNRNLLITVFRSEVNLVTGICILAVDFNVFPRRFAKTESFGYSVMDAGVGLFCVANAIVSREATKAGQLNFHKELLGCIPLVLLGCLRFLATKQTDYQVNILEYGVHWNFFLTLASVKLLSAVLTMLFRTGHLTLSIVVILLHQCILQAGAQDWILGGAERTNFISANREGIVSTLGYVAIYFAGVDIGRRLRRHPTQFRHQLELLQEICFGVLLSLWLLTVAVGPTFGVSRRLANIGYFIWIMFCAYALLGAFLVSVLGIHIIKFISSKKKNRGRKPCGAPKLLEAVNYNGLVFFLLANVLTGLVNVFVQTLQVSALNSILIISAYMFVTCAVVFILYHNKIKLKFW